MMTKHTYHTLENDVTPEDVFHTRRQWIKSALSLSAAAIAPVSLAKSMAAPHFTNIPTTYRVDEKINSYKDITTYNNFYELGTGKDDPHRLADALDTSNWKVEVTGECNNSGIYPIDFFHQAKKMEERIYRFRCVEAWSMVIPWNGISLASVLKQFAPTSKAKYVYFETIYDKNNPLPGQKRNTIDWPYQEGLRIDEAMHPLSFLATGIYNKPITNQNGAPIRLVVPWKYGFKSIKSIVKIHFSSKKPPTSWHKLAPQEYGFFANVNPHVSHPRWSQARERRLGELFKRDTLMFNGYPEVADLYKKMDLTRHY